MEPDQIQEELDAQRDRMGNPQSTGGSLDSFELELLLVERLKVEALLVIAGTLVELVPSGLDDVVEIGGVEESR